MMINTLNYMVDHPPDVDWLITLMGIWAPNDEIFDLNYRFVNKRVKIEAQFDNSDGLWTSGAPLTDRQIKRSNRIRLPLFMR